MSALGSVPESRRQWRRTIRAGLFWTALGFAAATISYAFDLNVAARSLGFDRPLSTIFFALVPIPALALGLHGLALALRLRAASRLADRTASYLAERLPESFVVVPHYGPRDGAGDEVAMVVIGPPGVVVIEPREETGEVVCVQDHWYRRKAKFGVGRRMTGASPSQRARWNAARVRSDIASGGFSRTPVEALVIFTEAKLDDVSNSCVPVLAGLDAAVDHLTNGARLDGSADRTRALADALVGPVHLAVV